MYGFHDNPVSGHHHHRHTQISSGGQLLTLHLLYIMYHEKKIKEGVTGWEKVNQHKANMTKTCVMSLIPEAEL